MFQVRSHYRYQLSLELYPKPNSMIDNGRSRSSPDNLIYRASTLAAYVFLRPCTRLPLQLWKEDKSDTTCWYFAYKKIKRQDLRQTYAQSPDLTLLVTEI